MGFLKDFKQYSQWVAQFDVTPEIGTMGLAGYLFKLNGEVLSELHQAETQLTIVHEAGDALWYLARIVTLIEKHLETDVLSTMTRLAIQQEMGSIDRTSNILETSRDFGKSRISSAYSITALMLGTMNESYGKLLRDEHTEFRQDREKQFVKDFSSVILYLIRYMALRLCETQRYTFRDAMTMNYAKLHSRQSRNTIQGTGDYR